MRAVRNGHRQHDAGSHTPSFRIEDYPCRSLVRGNFVVSLLYLSFLCFCTRRRCSPLFFSRAREFSLFLFSLRTLWNGPTFCTPAYDLKFSSSSSRITSLARFSPSSLISLSLPPPPFSLSLSLFHSSPLEFVFLARSLQRYSRPAGSALMISGLGFTFRRRTLMRLFFFSSSQERERDASSLLLDGSSVSSIRRCVSVVDAERRAHR